MEHEATTSPSTTGALPIAVRVRRYLELIRFSHTVFALPFALLACVMALTLPTPTGTPWELTGGQWWQRLLGVLVCMVAARSAAMAFNRLVDARYDALNPRTASRHLPAGLLTRSQVIAFFAACAVLFIAATLLFLPNWLPMVLSPFVLLWICGYSLAKRFTSAAHLWLGVALAIAPMCAWLAIRGEVVQQWPSDLWPTTWLALAIALWVCGFDIIYACQDADFDRRAGLHSLPARLGLAGALRLSALLHWSMLLVLLSWPWVVPSAGFGWTYAVAWIVVAVLVIRQHQLVRPDDLARVGEAFFHLNAWISLGFCTLAALDCLF